MPTPSSPADSSPSDSNPERPASRAAASLKALPEGRWHAQTANAASEAFAVGDDGLDAAEAASRVERFGANRLPEPPRRSALKRLLLQFHNLLIYVLLAAGALTLWLDHLTDTVVILAVVVLNAVIGFVQEGRAERALEAIRSMIEPHATVLRGGQRRTIDADGVAPGDLVWIEPGDRVPADLRLVRARSLRIEEAVLTGESMAVEKDTKPVEAEAPLGDRRSMAYCGTFVAAGQGLGVAVGTGPHTELGRISALLGAVENLQTPLLRQMDVFARHLTTVILAVSAATFAFAMLLRGYAATDAFLTVVGLAVAAIPEGLPAILTITLAIGVQRMAGRHAIIRRLPAVETLGSVSVICSDKTGTLTRNEMTVRRAVTADGHFEVGGVGYQPVGGFSQVAQSGPAAKGGRSGQDGRDEVAGSGGQAERAPHEGKELEDPPKDPLLAELVRAGLLCNDAELAMADGHWHVNGDPMEGALVTLAVKAGLESALLRRQVPRRDEIPFDATHRFMATLHHTHDGEAFVVAKGAPERIVDMCSTERHADGDRPLDAAAWQARAETLASEGMRVLALATRTMPRDKTDLVFDDVTSGLTLLGIVGFIDPPREEAIAAVADCRRAGIRVVMITGDHAITAREIARQLGIDDDPKVLTGADLDALDEAGLRAAAAEASVFARTSPEHKLRLVEAMQAGGLTVAMTGDGVNDAPALKRADVGVAMGAKGTEAAKQAAEMVLADDNFASIVAAVREGRPVYDHRLKVIAWTLPTNGGEALTILAALAIGGAMPITPVQILWINMVTAVALGLTLAFEPTEPGTMRRPPRCAGEPILTANLVWRILFVSLVFVAGAFGIFHWSEGRGSDLETSRTLVVNVIVGMEILYLFSVRSAYGSALSWEGFTGSRAVLIGVAIVLACQAAFTWAPPLQVAFASRSLDMSESLAVAAVCVAMFVVVESEKALRRFVEASRARGAR
jgi:magnesium-transporting ATPase (P-type)